MRLKKIIALLSMAVFLAGATGCQKTATEGMSSKENPFPGTPQADTLVLDVISEPPELNLMLLQDSISAAILRHCMSGLTRLDSQDNPVLDLAKKIDISPDGTIYTIELREDNRWSNGDPVTAHDFYFSWMTQLSPDTGSLFASYLFENIKNGLEYYEGNTTADQVGIQVLDDNTFQVEWNKPMPSGLFYFAFPTFFPINQKAYEEIGPEAYAKSADQMVTNGPYRLTQWVSNDHILLEKDEEHYAAKELQIPKLKLTMIGDTNTRLNAFMAGEVDVCNIYSSQIEQMKDQGSQVLHSYLDGGSWYLNFNHKDSFLANESLRKALAYGVDVQSLLDHVINDGSVAADGLVPEVIAGAGEETYSKARGSLFAYDLEGAKKHLEQALTELGVTREQIKLSILCNDSSYGQNQAAYLQQQWKSNLGLDVEIRAMAWKALSELKKSGDFQINVDGWSPDENDPMTFLKIFETDDSNNTGSYSNPDYDLLIQTAKEELDLEKRQRELIEAETLLMKDMAIGPLYFTRTVYAQSAKVGAMWRTSFQLFSLYDGANLTTVQ